MFFNIKITWIINRNKLVRVPIYVNDCGSIKHRSKKWHVCSWLSLKDITEICISPVILFASGFEAEIWFYQWYDIKRTCKKLTEVEVDLKLLKLSSYMNTSQIPKIGTSMLFTRLCKYGNPGGWKPRLYFHSMFGK